MPPLVVAEDLALQGEGWPAALVTPDRADRYGRPVRYDRLPHGGDALIAWVLRVGEDGLHVLRAVRHDDAPPGLRELRLTAQRSPTASVP